MSPSPQGYIHSGRSVGEPHPFIGQRQRLRLGASLILILMLFVGIRLAYISKYSFDSDEAFSAQTAGRDLNGLLLKVRSDKVHPPVYYILLSLWTKLGNGSEVWLRSFSLAAGVLGLLVMLAIAGYLRLGWACSTVLGVLLAVQEFHVFYADHARMYTLLAAEAALAIFLLEIYAAAPGRRKIVLYSLSLTALVMTHFFGWTIIAAQGCYVVLWRRSIWRKFAIAVLPALFCSLAWIAAVTFGTTEAGSGTLASHLVGFLAQPTLASILGLAARLSGGAAASRTTAAVLIVISALAIAIGLAAIRRKPDIPGSTRLMILQLCCCAFIPPAGAFLVSRLSGISLWLHRYLIISSIPYLVLVVYGLSCLRRPSYRWVATALLVALSARTLALAFEEPNRKLPWNNLAEYIASDVNRKPIVVVDPYIENALVYYLEKDGIRVAVQRVPIDDVRPDGSVWIAYNAGTWQQPALPEDTLRHRGYSISQPYCISTSAEEFCVFQAARN